MDNANGVLGWNDVITYAENDFTPLPEGDYPFTIDQVIRGNFNGSEKTPPSPEATVIFRVHGEDTERTIRSSFILHTNFLWKLSQLFVSVGLMEKGGELKMDWEALPGLTGRCHVKQKPGTKKPNQMFNEISELYPKEEPKYTAGSF